jgi:hypothetical protein
MDNKEILQQTQDKNEQKNLLLDVEARTKVPENIKNWLEKIEGDPVQMRTVNDDSGQPLLQTSAPQDPRVVLPITRQKFVAGFKKTIDEAGKWLSTFILRLIKIKEGNVKFKEE